MWIRVNLRPVFCKKMNKFECLYFEYKETVVKNKSAYFLLKIPWILDTKLNYRMQIAS